MKQVEYNEFEKCLEMVRNGEAVFYIPTYTRCTKIDRGCLLRFDKVGQECIRKDNDGKGYRLASGRNTVYVFNYLLKMEAIT